MVIVAGFLGFCAVLRAPVGVIPPLLTRLGQDLGMGEVARGALTSVPIPVSYTHLTLPTILLV